MAQAFEAPYRVSVVVQTHWDREWYFPQQTFATRLLAVMARVCDLLDRGELRSFLFDGQVAAMDDLLSEAEPALAARVRAHAQAGRIVLGPWYVMADEFLVSGESLCRNLEIGMKLAHAHGNCQRVGYLPDSFGHVAQMPQILRQHGIGHAVTWRGIDLRHAEFRWQAPDGSAVDALYLPQGYYQHPLNLLDAQAALWRYLETAAPRSKSGKLLLTQGGDHLAPAAKLAERLSAFNASQERYELVQESLAEHFTAAGGFEGSPVVVGELRSNAQSFVLPDVLSTRRYLKEAHQQLEDRLLGETEPLWAWLKVESPHRAIEESWKRLLLNQAHDSICGCSVDAVHDEMESRFVQLAQRLDGLKHRAVNAAGLQSAWQHEGAAAGVFADQRSFTLFNPLPLLRTGWLPVSLLLQGDQPQALRVRDGAGRIVPAQWLHCEPARELRSPLDDFPEPVIGHRVDLRLDLPMQGMEARGLSVEACEASDEGAAVLAALGGSALPMKLAFAHGELVLDELGKLSWLSNGKCAQLLLHTELDAGDTYNFSPPAQPNRLWHESFELLSVKRCGPLVEVGLRARFSLSAGLNPARTGPSDARVQAALGVTLLLSDASPWIEARITHQSVAHDHRTRWVFAVNEAWAETAADTAFDWTKRPVRVASYPEKATPQVEMPVVVNPSLSAIQAGSLAITHRGLQEFEVLKMPDGRHGLGLTLQRAVGWLSRRDVITRGAGAGPDLATPGAQRGFAGETLLAFALDSNLTPDVILQFALHLRRPPLVLTGASESAWRKPLTLPSPRLIPSAIRHVADGRLELRVWNARPDFLAVPMPGWERVGAVGDTVGPHQIATYRRSAA